MSEKFDGVRALWTGEGMYSRGGFAFQPPASFTSHLPKDLQLDGELWTGRQEFQNVQKLPMMVEKMDVWKKVKYCIFDSPSLKNKPYQSFAVAILFDFRKI